MLTTPTPRSKSASENYPTAPYAEQDELKDATFEAFFRDSILQQLPKSSLRKNTAPTRFTFAVANKYEQQKSMVGPRRALHLSQPGRIKNLHPLCDQLAVDQLTWHLQKVPASAATLRPGAHYLSAFEGWRSAINVTSHIMTDRHRAWLEGKGISDKTGLHVGKLAREIASLEEQAETGREPTELDEAIRALYTTETAFILMNSAEYAWTKELRSHIGYKPESNGRYPARDIHGKNIEITLLPHDKDTLPRGKSTSPRRKSTQKRSTYDLNAVAPFISPTLSDAQRSKLYDSMKCVEFSREHIKNPSEKSMLGQPEQPGKPGKPGQNTVIATRPIKRGECLGVYGGSIIQSRYIKTVLDDTNLLNISRRPPNDQSDSQSFDGCFIDGDNILSQINTICDEAEGKPVRQSKTGYNVEFVPCRAQVKRSDGKIEEINLPVCFALTDIEEGEEFRVDYGYSEELVRKKIAGE